MSCLLFSFSSSFNQFLDNLKLQLSSMAIFALGYLKGWWKLKEERNLAYDIVKMIVSEKLAK